jgi:hypothetical protein
MARAERPRETASIITLLGAPTQGFPSTIETMVDLQWSRAEGSAMMLPRLASDEEHA